MLGFAAAVVAYEDSLGGAEGDAGAEQAISDLQHPAMHPNSSALQQPSQSASLQHWLSDTGSQEPHQSAYSAPESEADRGISGPTPSDHPQHLQLMQQPEATSAQHAHLNGHQAPGQAGPCPAPPQPASLQQGAPPSSDHEVDNEAEPVAQRTRGSGRTPDRHSTIPNTTPLKRKQQRAEGTSYEDGQELEDSDDSDFCVDDEEAALESSSDEEGGLMQVDAEDRDLAVWSPASLLYAASISSCAKLTMTLVGPYGCFSLQLTNS